MSNIIIKLPEVKKITCLSRSSIYRLMSQGKFPKQIKLSSVSSGWVKQEVDGYIQQCINARGK